jgi:hypothetical protein
MVHLDSNSRNSDPTKTFYFVVVPPFLHLYLHNRPYMVPSHGSISSYASRHISASRESNPGLENLGQPLKTDLL